MDKGIPVKKSKKKAIILGSIIGAIILIIIIVVVVVLAVVLTAKNNNNNNSSCRYGSQNNECIRCGLGGISLKIVGGEQARENSWPSLALIWFDYKFDVDGKQSTYSTNICGGTLINQDTVLTAAHCFQNEINNTDYNNLKVELNKYHSTFESMYTIYLGAYDITKLNGVTKMKVKSFILHPNYDENSVQNDIAIIKLDEKVNLNEKIQIACVPDKSKIKYPNDNIDGYIAGWGATDTDGEVYPDILKQAKITIYQSSKCNNVAVEKEKNWDKQICAGKYEGGVDSCQGDSGGPLYVRDQIDSSLRYVVAGVVSYGEKCGAEESPGIYVRVSGYLDWIEKYW